jgi:hypothetical protein
MALRSKGEHLPNKTASEQCPSRCSLQPASNIIAQEANAHLAESSTLQMEAACLFETSVNLYHIPFQKVELFCRSSHELRAGEHCAQEGA